MSVTGWDPLMIEAVFEWFPNIGRIFLGIIIEPPGPALTTYVEGDPFWKYAWSITVVYLFLLLLFGIC